jgi:hypothetical protein
MPNIYTLALKDFHKKILFIFYYMIVYIQDVLQN